MREGKTAVPPAGTAVRRKPGPKPKSALAANGSVPSDGLAGPVALLRGQLASAEGVAARIRKALAVLAPNELPGA